MRRLLPLLVALVIAVGVGVYASVVLGRVTMAIAFLVVTTLSLAWALWVVGRAAQALVKEPAAADEARATGRRRKELEREKQALLKALKELEFDFQMGKVSEADYKDIGGNYRARAVRVLKQLDAKDGSTDYRALVERDLKNRLVAKSEPEPESESEPEPESGPERSVKTDERPRCPKCETGNDLDAEFCKKCGARLTSTEATS